MTKNEQKISRFLTLVLRHDPASIGLKLDSHGWANIDELIRCLAAHGKSISLTGLQNIVAANNKQRFAFSEDASSVRASQGHSVDIDLKLTPKSPPESLYHGTSSQAMNYIEQEGLSKMSRQHVHLSSDVRTAHAVGNRHGKAIILEVATRLMESHGFKFFQSDNGVWLTDSVPPDYLNGQIQI